MKNTAKKDKTTKARSKQKQEMVWFRLDAPNAKEVKIAGDFSEWEISAKQLEHKEDGIWEIGVSLPPGIYEYKFLVDGEWWNDPRGGDIVMNPFGSQNNVLQIV